MSWMALVASLVLLAGGQVWSAAPAGAAVGVTRVWAESPTDSSATKTVHVGCPFGLRPVGGGGEVFATNPADAAKVMLTEIYPSTVRDDFLVNGDEVAPGITGSWRVVAYALCVNEPPGYERVYQFDPGGELPGPVEHITVRCPGTKQVIGTGSRIEDSGGLTTLQLARADGAREIARTTTKDIPGGGDGTYSVSTYALCTNPLPNFQVRYGGSTLTGSENTKTESVTCPAGTFVHGMGAATSGVPAGLTTAPAGVAIQAIVPSTDKRTVTVRAVETFPTSAPWDLAAQAICGPAI
jgi:hypothetical protein